MEPNRKRSGLFSRGYAFTLATLILGFLAPQAATPLFAEQNEGIRRQLERIQTELDAIERRKDELLELRKKLSQDSSPPEKFTPFLPATTGHDASQKYLDTYHTHIRYADNRVTINLVYRHRGGFLGKEKREAFKTDTILLTDGSLAFALLHVEGTPFRLRPALRRLVSVEGSITSDHLDKPIVLERVAFLEDPRILIIPVFSPLKNLREAGLTIFQPVEDTHVFNEAVTVDSGNYNLGQTSFTRDPQIKQYARMSQRLSSFPEGHSQAAEGDLVFSQTGHILGIMVNDAYALLFKDLNNKIRQESITYVGDQFEQDVTMRMLTSLLRSLSDIEYKFR